MSLTVLGVVAGCGWLGYTVATQMRAATKELGRFRAQDGPAFKGATKYFDVIVSAFARRFGKEQDVSVGARASKGEREMARKLADAGLETTAEQGKFFLFRTIAYVGFPLMGASLYLFILPYYATIFTLMLSGIGIVLPMFWLRGKITGRTEEIQRELPLILDLTNLGTSAGWDVASSLERVIDSLYAEFPHHPLIKEFKRARWLSASGYTWEEAMRRVGIKLNNETVKRTTMALGQAIRQGGDRSKQLEGIAEDAQRVYYSELDRRLAALPVKALLATMMLMVAYFVILLAPAAVQIKNTASTAIKARVAEIKAEKGSVTLIETVVVMTLALALLLMAAGFQSGIGQSVGNDTCIVQHDTSGIDLADPDLNVALVCPTPETDMLPVAPGDPGNGGNINLN